MILSTNRLFVLLFLLVSFITSTSHQLHFQPTSPLEPDYDYGIIVDAGSTQTRLYIYVWSGPSNASITPYISPLYLDVGTPNQRQAKYIKEGGIADLKSHKLPKFIDDLIQYAKTHIPKPKYSDTPIFFLATSGVRILSQHKRERMVETVSGYLRHKVNSPFRFDEDFTVQVLPGEFEGAFDWLSLNYLAGTLEKNSTQSLPPIVSIDLGGVSLELTFEPEQRLLEGAFPLRVNGTDKILYTQSYLKFGRNQALLRYRELLVEEAMRRMEGEESGFTKKRVTVEDPCFPIGYVEKIKLKSFRGKVKFVGTGNFTLCTILTKRLLRLDQFCPAAPCAMAGKHQPPIPLHTPIYAVDGYVKLANFLACSGKSNLNCLQVSAHQLCTNATVETYFKLQSMVTDKDEDGMVKVETKFSECFLASYGINVLSFGFGIDRWREIYFEESFQNTALGWTLGAMIYELERYSFSNGECPEDGMDIYRGMGTGMRGRKKFGVGQGTGIGFGLDRVL